MSRRMRAYMENLLFDTTYDMDCIGGEAEIFEQISMLSDQELADVLTDVLANLNS